MNGKNPDLRIAAVFATMNRAATAKACVAALASQTRPPDQVFVADNCSQDDTVAVLQSMEGLPFELIIHPMDENRGNAGGIEVVMDLAFSGGADGVWILDDDSWPRPEALSAMVEAPWEPKIVGHALQIDPASEKFTWPLQVQDGHGGWKLAWTSDEIPDSPRFPSRISWTGALLSKEVRESVGPVLGELFIRGEDEEYPWRIEQAGFTQQAFRGAVMDHPGPANVVHYQFLGKHFFFEKGLADWKLYYKVRNMVWLKKKQRGSGRALMMAGAYSVAAVMIDGPQRIPLLHRAIHDGWSGRLGKM